MKERLSNFIEHLIGCFRVFLFGNDIEVMIPSHRYTIVLVIRSKLFYRVNPNGIFSRPDIVLQRELCCLKLHAVRFIKRDRFLLVIRTPRQQETIQQKGREQCPSNQTAEL